MEYMARVAYNELRRWIHERVIDFHILEFIRFSRREVLPQVTENVRGRSVYLFYDFNGDTCHDTFVMQLVVSTLQDAGADTITLVMPYMPFLRQDRKDRSRVPISAKVFISGYERFEKVERTITLDMHAEQTQGVFTRRSDHLPGHVVFIPWIKERFGENLNDLVIVGPDAGSEKRVTEISTRVGCERAFLTKRRDGRSVEMHELHGASVNGKTCLINDDIIDTASTAGTAIESLRTAGAKAVILSGTHAVFGEKAGVTAYNRLEELAVEVVVTDSLQTRTQPWLTVLPLGRFMGHAILQNNIPGGSVSKIISDGLPV